MTRPIKFKVWDDFIIARTEDGGIFHGKARSFAWLTLNNTSIKEFFILEKAGR